MFLQGTFSLMSAAALIQTLCQEQRSVRIEARHGGCSAYVWLADGLVIAATCEGREGAEAIYRLVGWADGDFHVRAAAPDTPAMMMASAEELLLEAARRRDEQTTAA
jgi:hypothetical protein